MTDTRLPYRPALAVGLLVFFGYLFTLAPTVTFWDAGEFIAAARILGIPHPPGTPLFVLLGNFFGSVIPFGEFAWRTNLMTALFSASSAAFFFLVVVSVLRESGTGSREPGDALYAYGGGLAAALVSAFVFTVWQNSNETEVYMVATLTIAASCWLAWLWRRHRGTERASHLLLLIVYLGAVSIGNHLMALLVGPAIIGFVWHVMRTQPLAEERDRQAEWAQLAVLTGGWALLIGVGLGSTGLLVVGGALFVVAAIYATMAGSLPFAVTVLGVAVIGVSTYYFLYVRAGLQPFINEADPSTFERLVSVIRREQYPPRSPLDDPTVPSGPDNPGRSLTIMWLQMLNYLQYFDWQWANGLNPRQLAGASIRAPFTALFFALGITGLAELKRRDRSVFWMLLVLFLTTGPALMGYMNFKPGFSIGYDLYPDALNHEVRDRDYFFTVSFQVWGLFAGFGLASLYRTLRTRGEGFGRAAPAVFALALLPFALNFGAASRKHGPEARLANDFAYNLLQSVEPYGILFVNGDNDTFPLWWAQEVEGIRQDVAVVNLSLGNTEWYLRQLRDNPIRPFVAAQAPWFADRAPPVPTDPLHSMTDAEVAALLPQLIQRPLPFRVGRVDRTFPANSPFYVKDVLMLRLIQENWSERPIYWSITAGQSNWLGLGSYLVQEGMALRLTIQAPPDTSRLERGLWPEVMVDLPRTDSLVREIYRYGGLWEADTLDLDPTATGILFNLANPHLAAGQGWLERGDNRRAREVLERAYRLAPNPQLAMMIQQLSEVEVLETFPLSDSASPDSGRAPQP